MKTRKKYIVWGSIVLALILVAGTGLASFNGPWSPCGHGFHGRDFHSCLLGRMDDKMAELNLSPDQQERYEQIKQSISDDLGEMAQNRKQFRANIKKELEADNPDVVKIAALIKTKVGQIQTRFSDHLDEMVAFYAMLDDQQKAQVLTHMREKMNRFSHCRFGGQEEDKTEEQ